MPSRTISILLIITLSSTLCFTFQPTLPALSHRGGNVSRVTLFGVLSRSTIISSAYGRSSANDKSRSKRKQNSVKVNKTFLLDVIDEAIFRQDLALESIARELKRKEEEVETGVSSLSVVKIEKRREDLNLLITDLSTLREQLNDTKFCQELLEEIRNKIKELGFSSIFDQPKSSWKTQQVTDNQFGRPLGFDGHVFYSPLDVPILVGKMKAHKDDVMRNAAQGGDLWFQVEDYNGSRVLLRTSLMKGTKGSKRCIQMAADLAAKYSVWGEGYESIPVMYTDSRKVAKRGSRVGQMKQKKSLGRLFGTPKNVEDLCQ